jgi:hypothetical protein
LLLTPISGEGVKKNREVIDMARFYKIVAAVLGFLLLGGAQSVFWPT